MALLDRTEGFDELVAEEQRLVTFRGVELGVLLNVAYPPTGRNEPEQRFSERTQSKIELRKSDLDSPPKVGEDIEDADGYHHRIQIVTSTEFTWQLDCEMTEPD